MKFSWLPKTASGKILTGSMILIFVISCIFFIFKPFGQANVDSSDKSLNSSNSDASTINIKNPPSSLAACVSDANYQKNDGTWWKDSGYKTPATDNTASFQAILTYACNNGYPLISVPSGNYYFSGGCSTPESFKQPVISGQSFSSTRFIYNNISGGKSLLQITGGSGVMCGGYIENIGFDGNADSCAIEILGAGGFNIDKCQFGLNKNGVLFHNTQNNFTEYCVATECDFTSDCSIGLEYRNEGTQNSFSGSGMRNCTINQDSNETNPKILIGKSCFPYNAPLSFQCWCYNSETPIIKNYGYNTCNFYGNITIEPFTNNTVTLADSELENIYYLGGVVSVNENLALGNLILCDRIQLNSDGSLNVDRKPYSIKRSLTSGDNALVSVNDGESIMMDMHITAPNYEYNYTIIVYKNSGDDNGFITTIASHAVSDGSSYGAPKFSFYKGNVILTNSKYPASGTSVQIKVTQIGSRTQYFMN